MAVMRLAMAQPTPAAMFSLDSPWDRWEIISDSANIVHILLIWHGLSAAAIMSLSSSIATPISRLVSTSKKRPVPAGAFIIHLELHHYAVVKPR